MHWKISLILYWEGKLCVITRIVALISHQPFVMWNTIFICFEHVYMYLFSLWSQQCFLLLQIALGHYLFTLRYTRLLQFLYTHCSSLNLALFFCSFFSLPKFAYFQLSWMQERLKQLRPSNLMLDTSYVISPVKWITGGYYRKVEIKTEMGSYSKALN